MSYAVEGYYPAEMDVPAAPAAVEADAVQEQTSWRVVFLFFVPVLISGFSYLCDGIGIVTDLSFLVLTGLCLFYLFQELIHFPKRQGIGAILIYGGVLVWFCHDYMWTWFWLDFAQKSLYIPVHVVAKAAFYHMLFVDLMVLVYRRPFMRWVDKLVVIVPEPAMPQFYVASLIGMLAVGIMPYFIFVNESPFSALFKTMTFREDEVLWTVGRTVVGKAVNLNYSWGGYVAQILQVGMVGGILGAAYAILVARNWVGRVFGAVIWAFWVMYAFTSYRRGDMAFMILPVVGLLFYRFQVEASGYLSRVGWKAYTFAFAIGLGLFVLVQYQFSVRSGEKLDLGDVFAARGNTMFSEGMKAWALYGEENGKKFYSDDFLGATIVEPIPVTLAWFTIDPIPRAFWTTKPIDQFAASYNDLITGEHFGLTGTTVSGGAVGQWYFRYGPAGVIEGGLMYGWLMGVAERALRRAKGRPIGILFAFAFATFMFRAYRDLWFHMLYPLMIGAAVLFVIVWPIRALPANQAEPAVV